MDIPVRLIRSMLPPTEAFGLTRFLLHIDDMPKGALRYFLSIYAYNTAPYDCTSKDLDGQIL